MGMPNTLVLVRHGQSEGNVAVEASKRGDTSLFTDAYVSTPGHQWRLTDTGRAQAAAIGGWLTEHLCPAFDTYLVSPYVRTRETAGHLDLPGARWRLNRALRERDWGDIGSVTREEFRARPEFELSARMQVADPLYWAPPGGESIAQVAEDRVRNVLSTLHREEDGRSVIAVTHGETMWSFRLVLERLNDDLFNHMDSETSEKIHNCQALIYTRLDPATGRQSERLSWLRRVTPRVTDAPGTSEPHIEVIDEGWRELEFSTYTNAELLRSVAEVPSLFV